MNTKAPFRGFTMDASRPSLAIQPDDYLSGSASVSRRRKWALKMVSFILLLIGGGPAITADASQDFFIVKDYEVSPDFFVWLKPHYKEPKLPDFKLLYPFNRNPVPHPHYQYIEKSQRLIAMHSREWHKIMEKLVKQYDKARLNGEPPDWALIRQLRNAAGAAHEELRKRLNPPKDEPLLGNISKFRWDLRRG